MSSYVCFWGVSSTLPDRKLLIPTSRKLQLRSMGSSGKMVPHNMSPAHSESFLRVPKTRRHMLYCETFLALGGHRSYMRSAVCNPFFLGICFFTVLTSCKLCCFSVRLLWHSVPLFMCIWPRVFIPLLQPAAQSCFFVTSRPGHCKHALLAYFQRIREALEN